MSIAALSRCKNYLHEKYSSLFAGEFTEFQSGEYASMPAWTEVDAQLQPARALNVKGALLRDPEIGICLFILSYSPETDIAAQMAIALRMRSKLLPEVNYGISDNADQYGAWRVALHWLVEKGDVDSWLNQIVTLRRNTAQFEEIAVDAIFNNNGSWDGAIQNYAFPKLLLSSRAILRKTRVEEIAEWKSADHLVLSKLKGFSESFRDYETRSLALQLENRIKAFNSQQPEYQKSKLQLENVQTLQISNFRNISDAEIVFSAEGDKTIILHGPNGTGKSNIFEALSLAIGGTSYRANKYLWDRDGSGPIEYVSTYLNPISETSAFQITLNHQVVPPLKLDKESSREALLHMDGTLLSQEASMDFLDKSADELGSMMLQGYSDLAQDLEGFVSANLYTVETQRKDFLRRYDLNANISKPDTAYKKIALNFMNRECPTLPSQMVHWFSSLGDLDTAVSWNRWSNEKESIAELIAKDISEENIIGNVSGWLRSYNSLLKESEARLNELNNIRGNREFLLEKLKLWHAWRVSFRESGKVDSAELESAQRDFFVLKREHDQLLNDGKEYKARLDHLNASKNYLEIHWSAEHPSSCPTCNSDTSDRGGILFIVDELRIEVERSLNNARKLYAEKNNRLKEMQNYLASLGHAENPISPDEQERIFGLLQPIMSQSAGALDNTESLSDMIRKLEVFEQLPSIPEAVDFDAVTENACERLRDEFARAKQVLTLPECWKQINKKLNTVLGGVVQNHLPETLGKVWNEIVFNLTSARWLLAGESTFKIDTNARSSKRASIVLKEKEKALTKYIFNKAETHIMGLAWFFTRYLTHGRFHVSMIGMDDPAQEMDQPTFRELCRFWESLSRLHKFHKIPLNMLIMLHQEERALDATRATGGVLHVLDWGGQYQKKDSLKRLRLLGEGYRPRTPTLSLIAKQ